MRLKRTHNTEWVNKRTAYVALLMALFMCLVGVYVEVFRTINIKLSVLMGLTNNKGLFKNVVNDTFFPE